MRWKIINILTVISLILVTGVQMRTGDMLEKIARGQRLSESDIATLRLKMNQQENMTSIWSGNTQGTEPAFTGRPEDKSEYSDHPYIKVVADTQEIPNEVSTDVTFGAISPPLTNSLGFKIDLVGDPTHITILETGIYVVTTELTFLESAAPSTYRSTYASHTDTGSWDNSYALDYKFSFASGHNTYLGKTDTFYGMAGSKISLNAYQSSGGALNISYAYITLYRLRGISNK